MVPKIPLEHAKNQASLEYIQNVSSLPEFEYPAVRLLVINIRYLSIKTEIK